MHKRLAALIVIVAIVMAAAGGFLGHDALEGRAAQAGTHWHFAETHPKNYFFATDDDVQAFLQTLDSSCSVQLIQRPDVKAWMVLTNC